MRGNYTKPGQSPLETQGLVLWVRNAAGKAEPWPCEFSPFSFRNTFTEKFETILKHPQSSFPWKENDRD